LLVIDLIIFNNTGYITDIIYLSGVAHGIGHGKNASFDPTTGEDGGENCRISEILR
jgi:hypothetical protein